jgi:cytoskeletal protein CcmA (bactofilin family)
MFRLKKPSESDNDRPTIAAQHQEPVEERPVATPPPRRTLPMPPRPVDGPGPPEGARRNNVPAAPTRADTGAARDKSLVIGKEVRLKGEISACDKMILEGDAEVTLADTRHLQVGASGWFRGSANVAEADVAGHFEGDLVARERLTVRPTGRIRGSIRYAQITVEAGGQITGEMTMLDAPATMTSNPQAAAQPVSASAEAEPKALAADKP